MTITLNFPQAEARFVAESESPRTLRAAEVVQLTCPRRAGARCKALKRCRRREGFDEAAIDPRAGLLPLSDEATTPNSIYTREDARPTLVDVLVDTNVILRALHRNHPQHRRAAREAITRLSKEERSESASLRGYSGGRCGRFAHGHSKTTASASHRIKRTDSSRASRVPFFDSETPTRSIRSGVRLVVTHGVSGKKTRRYASCSSDMIVINRAISDVQR